MMLDIFSEPTFLSHLTILEMSLLVVQQMAAEYGLNAFPFSLLS